LGKRVDPPDLIASKSGETKACLRIRKKFGWGACAKCALKSLQRGTCQGF